MELKMKLTSTVYFFVAICNEDICKNGGMCLFPNINCSCPDGWEGAHCETGKHFTGTKREWFSVPLHILAICAIGFCHNEGVCSFPNQNCTCTGGWSGPRCLTRTTGNLNHKHSTHTYFILIVV